MVGLRPLRADHGWHMVTREPGQVPAVTRGQSHLGPGASDPANLSQSWREPRLSRLSVEAVQCQLIVKQQLEPGAARIPEQGEPAATPSEPSFSVAA